MIIWTPISERLPEKPSTPYKQYLVWCTSEFCVQSAREGRVPMGYSGVCMIRQFCRDTGEFMPGNLVITHWAGINVPSELEEIEREMDAFR